MTPLRIFISSVQTEFVQERASLRDYLRGDPLLRRFFEVFLFEEVPVSDRRPDYPTSLLQKYRLTDIGNASGMKFRTEDIEE